MKSVKIEMAAHPAILVHGDMSHGAEFGFSAIDFRPCKPYVSVLYWA